MSRTKPPCESLHNHTNASDGAQTHLEVLEAAQKLGYGVVAFTDHDQLPKPETLQQLKSYSGPVKWLVGIEISSALPKELADDGTLHILGLFTDPLNPDLLSYCQKLEQSRILRMRHIVKRLTQLGFTISEQDCLKVSGSNPVGSPHIVTALKAHPQNQAVIEKMADQMKMAAQSDLEVARVYQRMISEGPRQYPYVLFMRSSSFFPMPKKDFGTLLDVDESVRLIRGAGGIAILAHWFFNQDNLPATSLERLVREGRLDGVETDVVNLITKRDISSESAYLRGLAQQHNLVQTIGADAHDADDLAHFAGSEAAGRSVGMTGRIIEKVQPALEWTNL